MRKRFFVPEITEKMRDLLVKYYSGRWIGKLESEIWVAFEFMHIRRSMWKGEGWHRARFVRRMLEFALLVLAELWIADVELLRQKLRVKI